MIKSLIVIIKLKLKYAINVAHYNTKDKIFNKKKEKLDFNNGFDAGLKAFYDNFMKLFFLVLILMIATFYFLEQTNNFNLEIIMFLTIFISLSVGIVKSFIAQLNEDAIYCVEYLKIKPSYYLISNYILNLLFISSLFLASLFVAKEIFEYDILTYEYILLMTFIYGSMRSIGVYFNVVLNKNNNKRYIVGIIIALLSCFLVYSRFTVPISCYNYIFIIMIILDIWILRLIFKYPSYDEYYNILHDKYIRKQVKLKRYESRQIIYDLNDNDLKKEKNPYKRFLNIFEKRYKTSLPKKLTKSSFIIFVIFIYCGFNIINNADYGVLLYNDLQSGIALFVIVLCFMNSGKKLIKHFFEKCDLYMDTHNFYKSEKVAKKMYKEKLKYMIKNNLLKTNVLAFSIIVLYYLTGENTFLIEYISILVSFNIVMIMFSMYYLTINLLYKPYDNKLNSTKWFNIFILYLPYYISFTIAIKNLTIINFGLYIFLIFICVILLNTIIVIKKIKE